MNKISELEQTRHNSCRALLHHLRVNGATARIDLAGRLNLSATTVTELTASLIGAGLVREVGGGATRTAGRGRPKVLIDLVPAAGYSVAVKLTLNQIDIVLGDYTGSIVLSRTYKVGTLKLDQASLNALLIERLEKFLQQECGPDHPVIGIGIAVQGVVDTLRGSIVWSYAISARNIAVAPALREKFGCPVIVLNDANCIALAIQQDSEFNNSGDMAVIMLGYGVGMGLIINNALYIGARGAAAEFGHTKYQPDGPICQCGKRGCIEAYIGDYALYRDAMRLVDLPQVDFHHPSDREMMKICDYASSGETKIRQLFEHAGRVLGFGIANLIALFGPQRILITGSGIRAFDFMQQAVRKTVDDLLVAELCQGIDIQAVPWHDDLTEIGAIKSALLLWEEQEFVPPPAAKRQ